MSRSGSTARRGLPASGVAAPADKRFRRSDVRPDRRRLGRTIVRVAKWVIPALMAAAAAGWLATAVLHSRLLAVQRVAVRGNVRLSTGEVQAMVDGIRGENIFHVDFDRYRRRLMDSPWVSAVTLWRVLPSTIEIRIAERVPMAIARVGQQLYLVDNTGVIIDEYGAQYRDFDLPIIDGLVSSPVSNGPLVDADRVSVTAAFLASLASRPDLAHRLSQVDVSNAHDVVAMFDDDTAWLHLGESQFTERVKTYLELAPTLKERFHDIDYVDLRFDERVFVHSRGQVTNVTREVP